MDAFGTNTLLKAGVVFGDNSRKQGTFGDVAWSLQYVNEEESLVFGRDVDMRKSQSHSSVPLVVIGLSAAHKYTCNDEKELRWALRACKAYAEYLGFEPSPMAVHRLLDLIQKMLIELVTMKPMPMQLREKPPEAEFSLKGNKLDVVLH